jgi:hypothetical protein
MTSFAFYCKEIVEANGLHSLWKHFKDSASKDLDFQRISCCFTNAAKCGYKTELMSAIQQDLNTRVGKTLLRQVDISIGVQSNKCSNPSCKSVGKMVSVDHSCSEIERNAKGA